ncbi:uncharacterized protein CIMG_05698 [Coccidioides immitis RS]|uniref:Uncharacterized protein n=1 Tax=Coccidioides immitis (strain RS) TaxID=246410 RepID=J3K6K0_COCIM|nr:uncharacterized protein CIMG_05698 [Coccidioides immitis RS]EAS30219.3 hypothetical protein CIMG_05698 [Coccidioides immitis RS]
MPLYSNSMHDDFFWEFPIYKGLQPPAASPVLSIDNSSANNLSTEIDPFRFYNPAEVKEQKERRRHTKHDTASAEPASHHERPLRIHIVSQILRSSSRPISQVEGLPLIKVELGQEMEVSAMKQVPSYLGLGGIVKPYLKMEYIILLVSRAKIARLVSRRNRKEKYQVEDRMDTKNDKLAPPYRGLGTSGKSSIPVQPQSNAFLTASRWSDQTGQGGEPRQLHWNPVLWANSEKGIQRI